jgi:hypothetical protein
MRNPFSKWIRRNPSAVNAEEKEGDYLSGPNERGVVVLTTRKIHPLRGGTRR